MYIHMSQSTRNTNAGSMSELSDMLSEFSASTESDTESGESEFSTPVCTTPVSIGSWSCFRCPGSVVAEAFQDPSPLRIPSQIANATGTPIDKVLATFDEVLNGAQWRTTGNLKLQDVFAYAKETQASAYFYEGGQLREVRQTSNQNKVALVFCAWCDILYFFKGAGARGRDDAQRRSYSMPKTYAPTHTLAKAAKHPPLPIEEFTAFPWHMDLGDVPAGLYWLPSEVHVRIQDDVDPERCLRGLLNRFLHSRRYPLITKHQYKDGCMPHELAYHKNPTFDNGSGTIRIRSHAKNSLTNAAFARRLEIPYAGQTTSSLIHLAIDTLLRRRQRRHLTDTEKATLLESQRHTCKLCGDCVSSSEAVYDHTIPLHTMEKDQDLSAFQALCSQCHVDKSKSESRPCVDKLMSHFNPAMRSLYLSTKKPPCQSLKDSGDPGHLAPGPVKTHMAVDIIRSRYNALYEATEIPVFSVLDDPEPIDIGKPLPDIVFIDANLPEPEDLNSHLPRLPYIGKAWYYRPSVEYLLHTKRVTWDDLKWGVTATGHLPGDRMREVLDIIDAAWEDVVTANENVDHNGHPGKYSINAWVGLCGCSDVTTKIKTRLTYDGRNQDRWPLTRPNVYGITGLWEFEHHTQIINSGTFRPIYDYCLSVEHTRLAQTYQACRAVYKEIRMPMDVLNLTTDGFIFPKPRKSSTADKLKKLIESLTTDSLPRLEERICAELGQAEPKQKD